MANLSLPLRAAPLAEYPFGLGVTDGAGFRALREQLANNAEHAREITEMKGRLDALAKIRPQ